MTARIGLVLAGGGAKGSYQAGVVRCLAEAGVRLAAVAGASIGALNAAIVSASGDDLASAAHRLDEVWTEVGRAAGQVPRPLGDLLFANPVARPEFLEVLLARHVDPAALARGLPLWVSVYRSPLPEPGRPDWGWIADVVRVGTPEWLHVNALPPEERHAALCASAALPVFIPPKVVNGVRYRDGGITDNTPIGSLLAHTSCDLFIVVHLKRGTLWDAREYAPGRVVEIRPSQSLDGAGRLPALLDFSSARAATLRQQGYQDARRAVEAVRSVASSRDALAHSQDLMLDIVRSLDDLPE